LKEILDIQLLNLLLGFIILVIPVSIFIYFRVKLVKDLLISVVRMVAQLSLVALYLEWIFNLNNAWVNSLWVVVMIFVGITTTIRRVGIRWRYFLLPFLLASATSVVIIDAFFLGLVLNLEYTFDARYFVPITGMVLGNSLNHNIVGLSTYFDSLSAKSDLYYFLRTNSRQGGRVLHPFIGEAINRGMNPLIATMSVIGLISLPGMMTGQTLGGSSPTIAIKYQVMIMLAIFGGCILNLVLSILISNRFIFDNYQRFRKNVLRTGTAAGKNA